MTEPNSSTSLVIWLSDHWLPVLAVIAAIVVPLLVLWLMRRSGRIQWWVERTFPLLSDKSLRGKQSDVSVLFEGNEIENPWITIMKFRNSRIRPIKTADIEIPITIDFGEDAFAVSASIMDIPQDGPKIHSTIGEGGTVIIEPALINRNEHFSVKAIVSNPDDSPTVTGRIVDTRIKQRWASAGKIRFSLAVGTLVMAFSIILLIIVDDSLFLGDTLFEIAVLVFASSLFVIIMRNLLSENDD